MTLPPPVVVDLHDLRDYFKVRAAQHTYDSYIGVPISKFPEDLRVYEHLLWETKPDTVIELGTYHGGSALWFRDRLRTLMQYGVNSRHGAVVISVDTDISLAQSAYKGVDSLGIVLIEGNICDPGTANRVRRFAGNSCLVIDDSAHTYETTRAALEHYSCFVPPGGYMVIEDGCVDDDELRLEGWPRGVVPALTTWLETHSEFKIRHDLELYGMTCHPGGFLQRRGTV